MKLSAEQLESFENRGYLVVRNALTPAETTELRSWAQEVHNWPTDVDSPWMPYEEINAHGKRVLCRTENYANHHDGFNSLLRGQKILGLLSQLAAEDMLLFKEKINYKLAGSGGFSPHIDSTAYTHIKNVKHLSIAMAVDPMTSSNGGLEVVEGSHRMDVPLGEDNCIEPEWIAKQTWLPVNLEPGELLIFGSYLAHRSGANRSIIDRKALYATYNCAREGDLHDAYYAHRKVIWPPMQLRKSEEEYEEGALRYGFGSPMLSVGMGKQLEMDQDKSSPNHHPQQNQGSHLPSENSSLPSQHPTSKPTQTLTPQETATHLLSILTSHGQSDYIGEPISQLSHSLQAAHLASQSTSDPQTIVAALLHDIGQIMPLSMAKEVLGDEVRVEDMSTPPSTASSEGSTSSESEKSSASVGRMSHETLGAQYLLALSFPRKVAALVEAHVPAKRYLCATEPDYWDRLSEASKKSLVFQGGKMSELEVKEWDREEWSKEKVALRRWDDAAKEVDWEGPGVEGYRGLIERILQR